MNIIIENTLQHYVIVYFEYDDYLKKLKYLVEVRLLFMLTVATHDRRRKSFFVSSIIIIFLFVNFYSLCHFKHHADFYCHRHVDSVDNIVEENSSVFSLIRICWLPSARACGQ